MPIYEVIIKMYIADIQLNSYVGELGI